MTTDGTYLVSGAHDRTIKVWTMANMMEYRNMAGHNNFVLKVKVTPNNKNVISSSSDNTMRMWDIEEGKQIAILQGHKGYVKGINIGPNGKYLLSASLDETMRVWDLDTKKPLQIFKSDKNCRFSACDFSTDLRYIFGAGERDFRITTYNFLSSDERVASKRSPIVSNVERFVRETGDDWKGSIYALKFLIPGLAESFYRYTIPGEGGNFDEKLRLLNYIYFPMLPEFYSLLHVASTAPFPKLLRQLLI